MEQKQVYDPKKRYQWEKKDRIILTGEQFAVLNQVVEVLYAQPETQKALLIANAQKVCTDLIKSHVEEGYFKEMIEEVPEITFDPEASSPIEGETEA